MKFNCWAEDIHGNRIEWIQEIPVEGEDSEESGT